MLERFRARAGELDRTNSYFHEDLAELRELGYLAAAVPAHLGGWGLDLAEMAASQRRLARYAPATALAMTMHSYWVGTAAELDRAGDPSQQWLLEAAVDGEVIAAGHAESGNDIPVLLSTCVAERVEGGYRLTGRKQFGSNGPAWTWLGAHAIDAAAPGGPQIVHAFVERTSPGVTVVETWDTLGMRPTQSHDTVLDAVFVPDARIGRVVPAGDGSDPYLVAMTMWALPLIATVYVGIAERALEVAVGGARRKTSIAIERGAYAYNPMVQHQVAEMYLELDAATGHRRALRRRLGGRRRSRRGLGCQGVLDEVAGRRGGQARRRHRPRRGRRCRHVQGQRAGAALPRRPLRRVPPGQRRHHPRDGRQVGARHHRRAAAVVTGYSARRACSTAASPSRAAPSPSAAS